jgi:hypothetical protein
VRLHLPTTKFGGMWKNRELFSKRVLTCDTPIHMFAAAATNQMTTNATVAVIIDEVLELARSFATPRHAVHSTKPTAMMIAVRMATSRRLLLIGEMVAET